MADRIVSIPPVDPATFTDEQRELAGGWTDMNFVRVIVRNPALHRVLFPFITKMIVNTELSPPERQVVVLRTLARGDDVYELTHHRRISTNAGMSEALIDAAVAGDGAALSEFDRVLIKATDELLDDRTVSDATWQRLAERYSLTQRLELVSLVGLYTLMNMLTRTCDIPLEPDGDFESMGQRREYV